MEKLFAKVVEKANTTAEGVTSLVIESGKVTQDDLATLKSMTRLTNLEMNLDGDLELIGAEGTATTVLPAELFINPVWRQFLRQDLQRLEKALLRIQNIWKV